jgi:FkbM family methyltransferase
MQTLLRSASAVLQSRIEPWRMRARLAKINDPLPSRESLIACWRAVRHAAQEAPGQPVSVPLGPYTLHGHNAADTLDLFYDIFIAEGYATLGLGPRPFIIDCGANIGLATLYFKLHYPDSRVLAFEPLPGCVSLWERNVIGNRLTGAELVPAAVGGADGSQDLFFAEDSTLGSSISHRPDTTTAACRVRVVRLSHSITEPVDLLKLDIEGAEQDVLEELSMRGALARIRRLIVEYHHRLRSPASELSRFLTILESHGFTYKLLSSARGHHFDELWQSIMIYAIRPEQ